MKLLTSTLTALGSICVLLPLSLIYAVGVGAFQFGKVLLEEMDELIKWNKQEWTR